MLDILWNPFVPHNALHLLLPMNRTLEAGEGNNKATWEVEFNSTKFPSPILGYCW